MGERNNNGPIYLILNFIIELFRYVNLVEFFKLVIGSFTKNQKSKIRYKNRAIDLFIALKWGALLLFFILPNNPILTVLIFYLICANLFTYFYYHFWDYKSVYKKSSHTRIKRRFINLIQSISFTIGGFTYLYLMPFREHFRWNESIGGLLGSLNFSFSNTFIGGSSITAITNTGLILQITQYCFSFLFLAILLSFSFNYNIRRNKND